MSSSFEPKGLVSTNSESDVDPRDLAYRRQQGTIRTLDSVRMGLSGLSLLAGIAILGTSANAIMVYNETHVSSAFNLPLWPTAFDLRPTVALAVTSSFIVVASLISLIFSQVRVNQSTLHTTLNFLSPMISFAAAVIGTAFFYAVNASGSADTVQSWTCHWAPYGAPRFGTLCSQSQAALYLTVVLIPLSVAALAAAAARASLARRAQGLLPAERKLSGSVGGSPALA